MKLMAMPDGKKYFFLRGRSLALDESLEANSDAINSVVEWAKEELDEAGVRQLIAALSELDGASDDLEEPGKPAKPAALDSRFPDASRLKGGVVFFPEKQPQHVTVTEAQAKAYAERFPEANRLKR